MDLPEISPDPSVPLPDVAPDSDQVPFRIGRKDPGGEYQYTTGYGPRGSRQPIQPPSGFGGGGIGVPDLGPLIQGAFQNLPVDQAGKAIEAATRYIGQRGYMRDLQSGANAAQAFAKWGPLLFRQATGIPEAIDRSVPTPITPQQMLQNRRLAENDQITHARLAAAQALAERKQNFIENKPVPSKLSDAQKFDLKEAEKDLELAKKDATENIKKKFTDPKVLDAASRATAARNKIDKILRPTTPVSPVAGAAPIPATAITHRYDPKTGKFEEIKPNP